MHKIFRFLHQITHRDVETKFTNQLNKLVSLFTYVKVSQYVTDIQNDKYSVENVSRLRNGNHD